MPNNPLFRRLVNSGFSSEGAELLLTQFPQSQGGTAPEDGGGTAAPKLRPGFWHAAPSSGTAASATAPAGAVWVIPFPFPAAQTISKIGIYVGTGAVGSTLTFGLYSADLETGMPDALLGSTAAASSALAGAVTGDLPANTSVTPVVHYLAFLALGGTPGISTHVTTENLQYVSGATTIASTSTARGSYQFAGPYTELPASLLGQANSPTLAPRTQVMP